MARLATRDAFKAIFTSYSCMQDMFLCRNFPSTLAARASIRRKNKSAMGRSTEVFSLFRAEADMMPPAAPKPDEKSLTCAGLGLKLRNLTPDFKFCSHVAFRGALGYRGTLRSRSDSGDKAVSTGSQNSVRCSRCVPIRCSLRTPARSKCRSATLMSLQVGEAFLLRTTGTNLSMTVRKRASWLTQDARLHKGAA